MEDEEQFRYRAIAIIRSKHITISWLSKQTRISTRRIKSILADGEKPTKIEKKKLAQAIQRKYTTGKQINGNAWLPWS